MNSYSIRSAATGEEIGWINASTRFGAVATWARVATLEGNPTDAASVVAVAR